MKCTNCNQTVTRKSRFCPNCGSPVQPRRSQRSAAPQRPSPVYSAILLGIGVVLGATLVKLTSDRPVRMPATAAPAALNLPVTADISSPAVLDIAREFMCFCGTCEDRLDVCDCEHDNGALEVKGFIAQKLREGHKKPHILELVREQYAKPILPSNANN